MAQSAASTETDTSFTAALTTTITATTASPAPALSAEGQGRTDFLPLFATSYDTEAGPPTSLPLTAPSHASLLDFGTASTTDSDLTDQTSDLGLSDAGSSLSCSIAKEAVDDEAASLLSSADSVAATAAATENPHTAPEPSDSLDEAASQDHSDTDSAFDDGEETVTMNKGDEVDAASTVAGPTEDGNMSMHSANEDAKSASAVSMSPGADADDDDDDDDDEESAADFTEFFVGNSSIADPLKYIAMSFEDKCRELKTITKSHDKHVGLVASLTEEKEQLQEALSESLSTRANLEEQVQQLTSELAALREELGHKDQLLATSDKISTSLFGVLMAAKSTLDSAGSLAPAMRSMSSAYAPSAAATDDDDDDDSDVDDEGASDEDDDDDDAQTADTDHEGADGVAKSDSGKAAGAVDDAKRAAAAGPGSPRHAVV
ncbi:uncharacterized protein PFL1_02525 [Pseudozyma flocculosa PF-1]|uniref:Uncharacterized protein n=2 Tax=Pseudozyma flocculosa TaxID=84751 RepID=A0A5C3EY52_9BASI|nr:uncharacterized protein PFL1_02525 [Pseudozyma flocculosa PF-1]EPQ29852.1 hypothetical protein PFL1_02525 [Pseudozyma flocculosa PF-1]SPO37148.1 uncharacterized protein PSFLO_02620 [Pseudozyma flocculosa]